MRANLSAGACTFSASGAAWYDRRFWVSGGVA